MSDLQQIRVRIARLRDDARDSSEWESSLSEALQLADRHNLCEEKYLTAAHYILQTPKTRAVAIRQVGLLEWMKHRYANAPSSSDAYALTAAYLNAIQTAASLVEIPPDQVYRMVEEAEELAQSQGYSGRRILEFARQAMQDMGNVEMAQEYNRRYQQLRQGSGYGACGACSLAMDLEYLMFLGEHERALDLCDTHMQRSFDCGISDARTTGPLRSMLLPLLEARRLDDVREVLSRHESIDEPYSKGNKLRFKVLAGLDEQAIEVFRKELSQPLQILPARFHLHYHLLLFLLTRSEPVPDLRPFDAPPYAELTEWLRADLENIARTLDERVGGHFYRSRYRGLGTERQMTI